MGGSSRQCQVCNEAQSKYKCPSCLLPCCSLPCYKNHKETPCAKPESAEEKQYSPSGKPEPVEEKAKTSSAKLEPVEEESKKAEKAEKPVDVDGPSEVLQRLQLEAIASSSEIRNALTDEHLQKLICDIDKSQDPINELDKAMGRDCIPNIHG